MKLNLFRHKPDAGSRDIAVQNGSETLQKALKMQELVQSQSETENWRKLKQLTSGKTLNAQQTLQVLKPEHCGLMYFILGSILVVTLLYLYILFISLVTSITSNRYVDFSLRFLCISSGILVLNAAWMAYAVHEIRFMNRWKKYFCIFQHRNTELLENIAEFTGFRNDTVRKDLKAAVKKGLICGGVFLNGDNIFSTSETTQYEPDQTIPRASGALAFEIAKLQAQCEGKIEISQMKGKVSCRLQREIRNVLEQYCYEIQTHSAGKENAGALLDIYIEIIDLILYDNPASLQHEKTLDSDRKQILQNINTEFMGLLSELCRE